MYRLRLSPYHHCTTSYLHHRCQYQHQCLDPLVDMVVFVLVPWKEMIFPRGHKRVIVLYRFTPNTVITAYLSAVKVLPFYAQPSSATIFSCHMCAITECVLLYDYDYFH